MESLRAMITSEMLIQDIRTLNFTISLRLSLLKDGLSEFTREIREQTERLSS